MAYPGSRTRDRSGPRPRGGEPRSGARRALPIGGAVALALLWGLSIPVTKIGLRDLSPLMLTALRYLVAAPFFLVFLRGRPLPPARMIAILFALGVLGIGIGQSAQAFGVQRTSASVGTIIAATIPIFMVVFAGWRLGQPVRLRHGMGLALAFGGIGVLALHGLAAKAPGTVLGDGLMLFSAVAVALYYVFGAELTATHGVVVICAWSSLFGALCLLPLAAWDCAVDPPPFSWESLIAVLYLGAVVTVAGLWIWLTVLRHVPVRIAASIQYLQPLVGVAVSALWFGDLLGPSFIVGAVLVVLGIALASSGAATVDHARRRA